MSVYDISTLTQKISGGTKDGHSLLQDWDILVAYDESTLNSLLTQQGAAVAALETVPEFQVTEDDGFGDDITYDYKLTLANPTLQFLPETSTGDFLQVLFTLGGSITSNNVTHQIPDGVIMTVLAPLVSAEGTVSTNGSFAADPSTVQDSSSISTLAPTGGQNMVCISLQKNSLESITFSATTPAAQKFIGTGTVLNISVTDIAAHLDAAASLSFYLTGVSKPSTSTELEDGTASQLQPVCFMFSLVPAKDKTTGGALCMYICVQGGVTSPGNKGGASSGLGLMDPSTLTPIFPIPSGRNAAIYFNHTLVMNTIFLPGFTNAGLTNIQPLAFDPVKGQPLQFTWPSNPGTLAGGDIALNGNDPMNPASVSIDSMSYDPKNFGSQMYIKAGISTDSADDTPLITFSSTSSLCNYTVSWSQTTYTWEGKTRIEHDYSGLVDVLMTLGGKSVWQSSTTTTTPAISTTFDPAYTLTQTPKSGNTSVWQKICGDNWSNQLPPQYNTVPPDAPAITLAFPQLEYFLATNLLLPGAKVFTPDSAITSASNPVGGVALPWDMIITGTIPGTLPTSNLQYQTEAPCGSNAPSTHTPEIEAPAVSSSPEDKFLSQVTSTSASNTLVTDLWNVMGGTDLDKTTDQLNQVVAAHGYQSLDVNKLSDIIGYSYDSEYAFMFPPEGDDTNSMLDLSVQDNPVYTFNLAVYSGVYSIDGKTDGSQLLLDPDTNAITYAGTTVVPSVSSDNATPNPKYTVTWSSGSTEKNNLIHYSVTFGARQILKTSNFQQFFTGTQTSDGSSKGTSFSGTKLATTPPFDLRLCAGTYVVSEPSDIKNSILYVSRDDGSLEWQGDDYQPTLSIDATKGTTTVSWTANDGKQYSIYFHTTKGIQYFSGTRVVGDTNVDFKGEMKQDGSDPGIHDTLSGWDVFGIAMSPLNAILSLVTAGLLIRQYIRYRQRDEKKKTAGIEMKARDTKMVLSTAEMVDNRKAAIKEDTKTTLKERLVENNAKWEPLNNDDFNQGALDIIEKHLNDRYSPTAGIANADGVQDADSAFWRDVHAELKTYVTTKVTEHANSTMDPVTSSWKELLKRQGYTDVEITDLTRGVLDPRINTIIDNFVGADFTAHSWARERADQACAAKVNSAYTEISQQADAEVTRLKSIVDTYPPEIKKKSDRIGEIDKELENKEHPPTPDKAEELKREKSGLDADIKRMQPEYDDAKDKLPGAETDKTDADKTKADAETLEPKAKERGDKAGREAFKI